MGQNDDHVEQRDEDPARTLDAGKPLYELGSRIGCYKLLSVLGEGGFGMVYLAEQEHPIKRLVALKVIKPGMDTKQVIARFETERQALALLDHPNIARVFDAGATGAGRPYFAMEYVKGIPITEYCDKYNLGTEERLRLFIALCHAIQHAHQKGIIHRDIKPSNALVMLHDEKPIPKIIDFGVAKALHQRLTERTLFTEKGEFIGTPEYMSPEQAELTGLDVDTRTDIYSLGVLLYELLTGCTPFDKEDLRSKGYAQMQRIICEQEPVKPSTKLTTLGGKLEDIARHRRATVEQLRKSVRGDLDWIVMKCLEKDRARRYDTANGLAMDLEHHLNNEPVLARPPSKLYRFQKLVRRNKWVFAGAVVVGAALVIGLAVSAVSLVREQHARRIAVAAKEEQAMLRQQAQDSELAMRRLAYASDMSLVQHALRWNNLGRAWVLLDRNRPRAGEKDLRGWEWRYLWKACQPDHAFELPEQEGYSLYAIDLSPDGRLLATSDFRGRVKLWDYAGRREISNLIERGQGRTPLCFSPSGKLLAVGTTRDSNNLAVVFDVETRQPVVELPHKSFVVSLAFTPDERRLVTRGRWGSDLSVRVWDLAGKKEVLPPFPVTNFGGTHHGVIAVSPDGRLLAIGGPNEARGVDMVTGETKVMFAPLLEGVTSLAFSPSSRQLAVGTGYLDGTVSLFDTASGRLIGRLTGHLTGVLGLRFSKDGKRLVSVSGDQSLRVWDVENWDVEKQRELLILRGHRSEVFCVALTPDDQTAVTGCKDGTLFGWDLRLEAHVRPSIILPRSAQSVEFSADSGFMFSVNTDGSASVWTTSPLREVGPLGTAGTNVTRVLPSPDGKYLVVGTTEGQVKVIDAATQREVHDLPGHKALVVPVGFARKGSILITVDNDGVITQ
jgi:serine/threonine protein kinase